MNSLKAKCHYRNCIQFCLFQDLTDLPFSSGGGGGFLYLTDEIIIEGAFLFLHSVVSSWFTSGTNTAVFLSNTRNHDVMVADDLYRITML